MAVPPVAVWTLRRIFSPERSPSSFHVPQVIFVVNASAALFCYLKNAEAHMSRLPPRLYG
jgi:hypothetical protein